MLALGAVVFDEPRFRQSAKEMPEELLWILGEEAIEKYGGFTGLNFMLSDGQSLHMYRDFQTNGQYYTLYIDNFGEMIVGGSEPILAMSAEPIPRGVLHTVGSDLELERSAVA